MNDPALILTMIQVLWNLVHDLNDIIIVINQQWITFLLFANVKQISLWILA